MNLKHLEVAELLESPVVGKRDVILGKIVDLLADRRDGRINFACIELRKEKHLRNVAIVPWSQFQLCGNGELRLDVSLDTLTSLGEWQ